MVLEKNIYEKICDILVRNDNRVPKIKKRMSHTYIGGHVLIIDIPKKYKELYHGSSYSIDCNEEKRKCDVHGNLVTKLGTGSEVKKNLEHFKCEIWDIHNYDTKTVKSTHVHFTCDNLSYDNILKVVKFLREF